MTNETVSFGQYLHDVRNEKGIELDEIAQKTNIQIAFLRDMEADGWQNLPEPVFLRGMFRNIAAVLNVDAQEMIEQYNRAIGQEASVSTGQTPREVLPPLKSGKERGSRLIVWILVLTALLLIGFYVYSLLPDTADSDAVIENNKIEAQEIEGISTNGGGDAETDTAQEIEGDRDSVNLVETPAETQSVAPPKTIESPTPLPETTVETPVAKKNIPLEVRATERTWIRLHEGTTSTDYMLQPGETVHLAVSPATKMVLGNAGGVEVIYNGATLPFQGLSGEVKAISFSQFSSERSQ